ncbi:hypothetical protein BD749_2840 [Pontibacter ramchanderi]|uniref:Uncharacterized protein n=1 Tax=Pontibacter ramchanderi TaxID=1179743 RepID=A0A2N3U8C9_9BACT|nr:hypothetical protein BD749_2840 [Pontibacter ramchanderi]
MAELLVGIPASGLAIFLRLGYKLYLAEALIEF